MGSKVCLGPHSLLVLATPAPQAQWCPEESPVKCSPDPLQQSPGKVFGCSVLGLLGSATHIYNLPQVTLMHSV
jgi:hypothetical protein